MGAGSQIPQDLGAWDDWCQGQVMLSVADHGVWTATDLESLQILDQQQPLILRIHEWDVCWIFIPAEHRETEVLCVTNY